MIYAGVEVSRKEGKKKLSVICVEVTKSSGPRTEPSGTPQEEVCQEDRSVSHFTRKQRVLVILYAVVSDDVGDWAAVDCKQQRAKHRPLRDAHVNFSGV